MSNVLFVKKGTKLNIKNNSIVVHLDEDVREVPISEISSIVIENLQCSLTAGVNILCQSYNVPIVYCDNKYSPVAISTSFHTYHKDLIRIQEQINWTEA